MADESAFADRKKMAWIVVIFLFAFWVPIEHPKVAHALLEAFRLLQWYAMEHTLGCVVPAMFIAGAISTFFNQGSVMKYLGPQANRVTAYAVASVSGIVLAVCSCSVLPMFAGIYVMGAGLGPASAFLYSGPAINVMAIFLSARVLGLDLGVARVSGAVVFAVVIGLIIAGLFRRGETQRIQAAPLPQADGNTRPLWKTALYFVALIGLLVFSDWYNTNDVKLGLKDGRTLDANVRTTTRRTIEVRQYERSGKLSTQVLRIEKSKIAAMTHRGGFVSKIYGIKWYIVAVIGLLLVLMLWRWFTKDELKRWMESTWDYSLMIVPLLFLGVFLTGFIGALIPESIVAKGVGGNSLLSTFVASFVGMIWYFATLTEIPIVEMLMRLGMGKGPALALLLAGPALSLPSILVINKVIGPKKTAVFCLLTVIMSTVVGYVFGRMF